MKDKSILIHCCCAHCTAYTVENWKSRGYGISAFWYNPNIHPFTEHMLRLEAMQILAKELEFELLVSDGYDMPAYFREVAGKEEKRCEQCFRVRLEKTAETAKRNAFGAFTSSLLISPHQQHDLLQEIGNTVAIDKNIAFLGDDLRKRYSDSRRMTKPMGLYSQQYCGCIYSEWERFAVEGM